MKQIIDAIRYLADRCGDVIIDGVGFNGTDMTFGKSLARQVSEGKTLSPKQLTVAHKMLQKYSKQLEAGGLFLPKTPPAFPPPVAAVREESRIESEEINRVAWCINHLKHRPMKCVPYAHQWDAVSFIVGQPNLKGLIADDMGMGKSISALMAAASIQALYALDDETVPVIVLAPVSLKINWLKEAAMIQLPIEVHSYSKLPQPPASRYILIADEVHYIQNIQSKRTRKTLDLATHKNCVSLIELSGTPMKNGRPSNMYPLLVAMGHPIASNRSTYERRYCDAKATHFTAWDTTGAANLEELRDKISDKLLRRTKAECLDLPEKIYTTIEFEVNILAESQYNEALVNLKEDYHRRVEAGEVSKQASALVFLGYLRRLASLYKSYQAIQIMVDLREQGQPVVIFTDFVDSAERIAEHFGVEALTGQTPQEISIDGKKYYPRQMMVDNFQSGVTDVFVGTIGAGGVGITLSAASYLIMLDKPWTPGGYHQATDRIHRIGQKRTCNIIDIMGKDIDYIMAALIGEKSERIDKVLKRVKIKPDDKLEKIFIALAY